MNSSAHRYTVSLSLQSIITLQGPLPHTICDFWKMAWDENVGYIVMLCEVMEGGKKKCERYRNPIK